MAKSDLLLIPGIGKTFVKDFARLNVVSIADLANKKPEALFARLIKENDQEEHATSKNYLYVIRMAIYYANGGREESKLKWNAWKD
jgi:predicted RecB family nuclease